MAKKKTVAKVEEARVEIVYKPGAYDAGTVQDVKVCDIVVDNRNDRLLEPGEAERELAESMASRGLLEPIVVGVNGAFGAKGTIIHLVAGHRRLAAAKLLKWEWIRATVRTYTSDDELQLDRATENIHRLELNPVEEAYAVGGMIEAALPAARQAMADAALGSKALASDDIDDVRYAAQARRKAIELVAGKLGKSVTWVTDRAYLSRLDGPARQLVLDGRLPMQYAREICKVADPKRRSELAEEYAAGKGHGDRPGDFDELKFEVGRVLYSLAQVPWNKDVPFAGAPACTSCPHNSANQPALFAHVPPQDVGNRGYFGKWKNSRSFKEPEAGVCTREECFKEKSATTNRQFGAMTRSLARRVKALPAKERPEVTAKKIAELGATLKVEVPRYLDATKLATAVKSEMAARPKAGKSKSSPAAIYQSPKKSEAQLAKERAQDEHEEVLRKRQGKLEKAILEVISKDPLRRAALAMVQDSSLWRDLGKSWDKSSTKAAAKPGLHQLINLLANPTIEGFRSAGEFVRAEYLNTYDEIDVNTDVVDRIAKALGIVVPPRPVLEEPKPAPKAEPEPEGKKSKKAKPAKKARGGAVIQEMGDFDTDGDQ